MKWLQVAEAHGLPAGNVHDYPKRFTVYSKRDLHTGEVTGLDGINYAALRQMATIKGHSSFITQHCECWREIRRVD